MALIQQTAQRLKDDGVLDIVEQLTDVLRVKNSD